MWFHRRHDQCRGTMLSARRIRDGNLPRIPMAIWKAA
jgi:hypothetical protein